MVLAYRSFALCAGLVIAAAFYGCSSDELRKGGIAVGCALNSECDPPLVCAFERCHQQCESTRDCPQGQACVATGENGVCQLEDESQCEEDADCGVGRVCASGACRAGCRDESACLASQRCIDGACEDVDHDAGSTGGAGSLDSGAGGSGGSDAGAGGAEVDAGPPPACQLETLSTDCPSNECRQATTCSVSGACVYEPRFPTSCGTCGLGRPNCSDPAEFVCEDIEVLGLSGAEVECDDTSPQSTFIFVDPTYLGPSPSGTRSAPFVKLSDALALASTPGRGATTVVIAGSPVYTEPLVLPDGVSVRGGYTATDDTGTFTGQWRRDLSRRPIWNVPASAVADHRLAGIVAEHIQRTTIVADVTIVTESLATKNADEGATNVGVYAFDAPGLRLFDVTVETGDGQEGADGAPGAQGPNGPNIQGVNGSANLATEGPPTQPGRIGAHNSLCDSERTQGGDGGELSGGVPHPGSAAPSGALGGTSSSDEGDNGGQVTTTGATGTPGAASASADPATGVFTIGGVGGTGVTGDPGFGGGGGYSDIESLGSDLYYYALGGSGGAGGCGGLGGLGGLPGGWSIGVLAIASPGLVVRGGSITAGNGGNGGAGGEGGPGGPGGSGGSGASIGSGSCVSSPGGRGSAGGQGGKGGVGAGGSSVAVYCAAASVTLQDTVLGAGKVGSGGTGRRAVETLGCD